MTRFQKRYDDGPRSIFLCRSGNTRRFVAIIAIGGEAIASQHLSTSLAEPTLNNQYSARPQPRVNTTRVDGHHSPNLVFRSLPGKTSIKSHVNPYNCLVAHDPHRQKGII
jgi:hypothetical protein